MAYTKHTLFPVILHDNFSQANSCKLGISGHYHEMFELFFLHQGRVLITLDGSSHYLESDQLIWILPQTVHAISSITGQPFFYSTIQFHPSLFLQEDPDICKIPHYQYILNRSYSIENIVRKNTDEGKETLDLYQRLLSLLKERPFGYEIGVKGYLELMLFALLSNTQPPVPENFHRTQLEIVYDFIESNYMNNISIDTLAVLCNMSKFYFIRYFRKVTQQTPIEYVNAVRIRKACQLLSQEENKILDIALMVGIQDVSYFNRLFKKTLGITPTRYREQVQKDKTSQNSIYYEEKNDVIPFYSYTY